MLRSLLPPVLALLLAPGLAAAAPREHADGHARGEQVRAQRDGDKSSSSSSSTKKSRGGGKSSSRSSSSGRSDSRSDDSRRDQPDARGPGGRPAPYGDDNDGRDNGSSDRSRGDTRSDSASKPDDRSPDARSSEHGPRSDGPGMRPDAARPSEGRVGRSVEMGRPPVQPTVRKVSVGTPNVGRAAPNVGRGPVSAPNPRAAGNFRSNAGQVGDRQAASHSREGRGGSDAERATYGSHAGSEAHREAERHARATAAYHRSSAAYHRHVAAERHRAWAYSRARYDHRWYRPAGWFAPWRPGYSYWYHGVFVYGPYPWYHHHDVVYVHDGDGGGGAGGDRAEEEQAPQRKVDRARTFAVGLRGGSYMGGYDMEGGGFGDAGLGLAVRYRPVEAVGLEVSWMHNDQTWSAGTERAYQPLQASVQLFALPWTHFNPYVLAGVTATTRQVHDDLGFTQVDESSMLIGPHAGVGLELGIGKKVSINGDLRYTGYLNKPEGDLTFPGAAQANLGLNFYF